MDFREILFFYLVIFGFFSFDALPTIIMHIQYFCANRNAAIIVRHQERMFLYIKNGIRENYSFDEIEMIIYEVGFGNGAWYSFSDYRYFVLVMKNGKKILISSLMLRYNKDIVERMFGMKVATKARIFPFVKREYLD